MMSEDQARQILATIQNKLMEDERTLNLTQAQIQALERESKTQSMVLNEVQKFNLDDKVFKTVGKMFLMTSKDKLEQDSKARLSKNEDTLKALNKKAQFVKNQMNDTQSHLKDILHSKAR